MRKTPIFQDLQARVLRLSVSTASSWVPSVVCQLIYGICFSLSCVEACQHLADLGRPKDHQESSEAQTPPQSVILNPKTLSFNSRPLTLRLRNFKPKPRNRNPEAYASDLWSPDPPSHEGQKIPTRFSEGLESLQYSLFCF